MKIKDIMLPLCCAVPTISVLYAQDNLAKKPNVVFILADDIGYGDFGCYGAESISTPNVDKIASLGVKFNNAYSPASTSSPTRYSLLTGEYAWRKKVGILPGDAALAISEKSSTLPKMMRSAGYVTGIVGKWHLGLGDGNAPVDFNHKVEKMGVLSVGFDYSYVFPATNDRVPTIYMENDLIVGLDKNDSIEVNYNHKIGNDPTGKENPELLKLMHYSGHDGTIVNGVGRMGWMSGGEAARWKDEDMSKDLLHKAQEFIVDNGDEPFFLYYASHNAHEPRVAGTGFKGVSKAGPYGDVIEEFDYCVGEIYNTLKEEGLLDNTIIIITSDNGPMIKEGYVDGALENIGSHDPFGGLSGTKYSLLEGGSKVPFIAYWASEMETPFVQEQRFCYIDMMATLAELLGVEGKVELNDSKSALELFTSQNADIYRPYILTQNNPGNYTLRMGDWKYIPQIGKSPAKLYNLKEDGKEKINLAQKESCKEIVKEFENYINKL